MKFYRTTTVFEDPWETVTAAFWRKYHPGNPYVSHIEGYDVISRTVDPVTKELSTTRIVLKRGNLPRWGATIVPNTQAYILEQSTVDAEGKVMRTTTRNLNHTRAMSVIESQTFRVHPDNSNWTQITTEARIVSNVGWGLKGRVEQFGISRFQSSTEKSRQALRFTLNALKQTLNLH